MPMSQKQKNLLTIYKLFDLWAKEFSFACQPGCSACCTQSVTMTRLEGELIVDYMTSVKPELLKTVKNLPNSDFAPPTTNQFAAACLNEEMLEEPGDTWNMAPCLFLENDRCQIYSVRPFICRSLGSNTPCKQTGQAEMDPLFLTMNTVILQCIEHLDQGRPWGNLHTILKMVKNLTGQDDPQNNKIRISQPIPGFLIPPEEMELVNDKLKTLLHIVNTP